MEIEIKPEMQADAPATVAEQAAAIVETAEDLAAKMARSSDDTDGIYSALAAMNEELSNRHYEVLRKFDELSEKMDRVIADNSALAAEISMLADPAPVEPETETEPEAAPVVEIETNAPVEKIEVKSEPEEKPQKRGRKWL